MPYIRMKVTVTGEASDERDLDVPGEYFYYACSSLTDEEQREYVLGQFDNEVPVKVLEDFDFVITEAPCSDADEYEPADEEGQEPLFWYLNVYLTDRAYGGPEEGGWWYDYGIPATDLPDVAVCYGPYTRSEEDQESMRIRREVIQMYLDKHNSERRSDLNSVLSEGRYIVCREGHVAQHWPKERPCYE